MSVVPVAHPDRHVVSARYGRAVDLGPGEQAPRRGLRGGASAILRPRHVGSGDSFQRQAVADALVDDAPQLLRQRHAGILLALAVDLVVAPGREEVEALRVDAVDERVARAALRR